MRIVTSAPNIATFRRRLASAGALGLALLPTLLLGGCTDGNWPVLNPDGPIAFAERELLYTAFGLMLLVIIPVYVLTAWVLLRYRASKENPDYRPDWQSNKVDVIVWIGPALIVIAIGTIVWDYTHRLDPYKPIASPEAPVEIQAIAQDWKWLFVYPQENIAAVNELAIPAGRPVSIRITSDTVMNSFYIPGLAGQIFAMAGMQTRLNLQADTPDTYVGRNTQYSGSGFPDQQFTVKAVSADEYQAWLGIVRESSETLDTQTYAALAKPSQKVPVTYYSSVEPGLFDRIIEKYTGDRRRRMAQLDTYAGQFNCGPSDRQEVR
ncbi:ubiquinol oxidase subunit II [Microbaculum sp. FT89]|uniref:ubiquinol oxidase subunit II n=1 Tax=Microbaculum sp. FT89 TaxID=3447298 RepID=UPI003F52E654